jgi:serine phosphatase RsbU (regulator of sigma subunit)
MTTLPKILIVDDEPFNVDYLVQELELTDCECRSAANGREALEMVRCEPPDLVLLDIMMPIMDGFEVLRQLKAEPSTRDIPVIVISASNDLNSVARGIQLGAEDYLPKPFEPILLHARVSSSLEKKHLHDLRQLYMKSIERELEIAREIQMSFLPTQLPAVNGWEIAAYFKAAREVAGDFYDAFSLPDDQLVFFVGDVCGKGVGAALFMTLYSSLIRAAATTNLFTGLSDGQLVPPTARMKQAIACTNNYITATHQDAKFATVFIGFIDVESGRLTYMNCGNEPAFLLRQDGNLMKLNSSGPAIGLFIDAKYLTGEVTLEKGDLLLAFTDGIADTMNSEESSFSRERLARVLIEGEATCDLLLQKIVEQANLFAGDIEQFDDITMMAVKRML